LAQAASPYSLCTFLLTYYFALCEQAWLRVTFAASGEQVSLNSPGFSSRRFRRELQLRHEFPDDSWHKAGSELFPANHYHFSCPALQPLALPIELSGNNYSNTVKKMIMPIQTVLSRSVSSGPLCRYATTNMAETGQIIKY